MRLEEWMLSAATSRNRQFYSQRNTTSHQRPLKTESVTPTRDRSANPATSPSISGGSFQNILAEQIAQQTTTVVAPQQMRAISQGAILADQTQKVATTIDWKADAIADSGWTAEQVAQAQTNAIEEVFDTFISVKGAGSSIQLQDMVNSYTDGNGSLFKSYTINTFDDFRSAFADSGESITRYINRMGKYWYGHSRIQLTLPS